MKLITFHAIVITMSIIPGQFKSGIQSTLDSTKEVESNSKKGH
jgi:hypothetical protein